MYTSNVIAAHILCLLSNSAIITSSKNEKRDVKEVAKINKNLHAVGLCDRAGMWCSESKKQTLYVILHVAGNHQVKKKKKIHICTK